MKTKNKHVSNNTTIAAISTPIGEAGIGIVRLSGTSAINIVEKIFKNNKKKSIKELPSYTIHYGNIRNPHTDEIIDEVILSIMKAPRSYTREDVIEINCHGGIVPLKKTLELIIKYGAKLAEPGEFTKRAFLNGRIDLTQAEAVIEIIKAKTELSLKISMEQLKGGLSKKIEEICRELKELLAFLEASIDFPEEEDVILLSKEEKLKRVKNIIEKIEDFIISSEQGKFIKDGISVVIAGKPNVGKSSLLNILLKEDRAIVTSIPGTTRDVIEETISIDGIPVRLTDTAGIRKTENIIEIEGVKRSRVKLESSDLVLFVLDGSSCLDKEDFVIFNEVKDKKTIVAINKIDLKLGIEIEKIKEFLEAKKIIKISATKEIGIDELKKAIISEVFEGNIPVLDGGVIITNLRHKIALEDTRESLLSCLKGFEENLSEEFICIDLRYALNSLGEIVGKTTNEDILNIIFSQFCIGK